MIKSDASSLTPRPVNLLELPLAKHARILHPELTVLKLGRRTLDIGALCYASRSKSRKKAGEPRPVNTKTLLKQRPKQILQIIKALSSMTTDGGKTLATVGSLAYYFISFVNWADANHLNDCLAGADASRKAFHLWAADTRERYQRQQFGSRVHNDRIVQVSIMLEKLTGLYEPMRGISRVTAPANPNGGTEPLGLNDFTHAVALNQAIFDGLCDLVLGGMPFPYKLDLPNTLGWEENHLWVFPTTVWRLAPHMRSDNPQAKSPSKRSQPYDYRNGRVATVDEIKSRYLGSPKVKIKTAKRSIDRATAHLNKSNIDLQNGWRFILARVAQRAFQFLFFCNTGGNEQVINSLETNGAVDAVPSNQTFRATKWRAKGKIVTLVAPITFMPRLRRFMELRQYLLQGRTTPFLFFTCGNRNNKHPAQVLFSELDIHYRQVLRAIDPHLPKMGSRRLRASVDDYYQRFHDSAFAALVMGHSHDTAMRNYARGSANVQFEEMTTFLDGVSDSARRQKVSKEKDLAPTARPLEHGGRCDSFRRPEAMIELPPVQPDCANSQGCLFCQHRILIAEEQEVRKVASAAYVMEQLILGPRHEEALRPSIAKCEEDLEKMAVFADCHAMVQRVRDDVYKNENLSSFWADKYQLFLELGII